MDPIAQALLTLGGVLAVGLLADLIGARVGVPRVTLLLLLGVLVGPEVTDLLPPITEDWFPVASTLALTMIGFVLGAQIQPTQLRRDGTRSATIAVIQGVVTALVVSLGLLAAGADVALALTLGGIAVATAPAATVAVVQERRADGPFTRTLLAVVALDDVIALVLFGLMATAATVLSGDNDPGGLLLTALWEVIGAVLLGTGIGLPAAALTGRLRPGRPTQEEAYALVLISAGAAIALEVSFLLTAIVLGATIANRARHHEVAFEEIERIEWPALVVFFVLAGASLDIAGLQQIGLFGVGYIVLRTAGKVVGCIVGAEVTGLGREAGRWLGIAMLPQAGVAIGLTLLAAERFPDAADRLIPLVIAATFVFELTGPIGTSIALGRTGEAEQIAERGDAE